MTTPNTQEATDDLDLIAMTMESFANPEQTEESQNPRNEKGQFTSRAGELPEQQPGEWNTLPDVVDGEQGQPIPPEPIIPDGHTAIATLPPEKVQGFKVLDSEGEILPPDLSFDVSFRDGQTRTMDLPQLVNFARQGVYNHELQQETVRTRNEAVQWHQKASQVEQTLQQARQERERLLTDPDYLLAQIEQAAAQNTPEARAQRERDQLTTQRQQLEYDQAAQSNTQYLDRSVEPALDTIVRALPTVQKDELASYLAQLIEPHKVHTRFGTILNPNATAQINHIIVHQLAPYAKQLHESRAAFAPKPALVNPVTPDPKVADLQARAAKAKRVATAALQPVGATGQPQGTPTTTKAPTHGKGMEDFIISKAMGRG